MSYIVELRGRLNMRKITVVVVILLSVCIFSGCNNELSGSKPPSVSKKTDNKQLGQLSLLTVLLFSYQQSGAIH